MARTPADVKSLARAHTRKAIEVLTGIMSNDKVQSSARVAAATVLLDRGWGRAAQSVDITGEITNRVIRSPDIATNTEQWLKDNAPMEDKHATH